VIAVLSHYLDSIRDNLRLSPSSERKVIGELVLSDFSPIIGYATGEGTLVFAFYCKD